MASVVQSSLELQHVAVLLRIYVFIREEDRNIFKLEFHFPLAGHSRLGFRCLHLGLLYFEKQLSDSIRMMRGVYNINVFPRDHTSKR